MPNPIQPLPVAPRHEAPAQDNTADATHSGALHVGAHIWQIEWLPPDVRLHIGGFLHHRSLLDFASSCRANWQCLRPEASWRRASMLASRARNLAQFDHAVDAAAACTARQRATLLSRLARELRWIPSHQMQTAVATLLAASGGLSIVDRVQVRLAVMHGLHQADAQFARRSGKHDQERESTLAKLGQRVGRSLEDLPADRQAALLPSYLHLTPALPAHQCAVSYWLTKVSAFAPADAVKTLTAAARWMIPRDNAELGQAGIVALLQFERRLCGVNGNAVPQRSGLLSELMQRLYALRDKLDPYPLWHALLEAANALPGEQRETTLVQLSMILPGCFGRSAARFQAGWLKLADAAEKLPAGSGDHLLCSLTRMLGDSA